jgi:hypothetical protein
VMMRSLRYGRVRITIPAARARGNCWRHNVSQNLGLTVYAPSALEEKCTYNQRVPSRRKSWCQSGHQ